MSGTRVTRLALLYQPFPSRPAIRHNVAWTTFRRLPGRDIGALMHTRVVSLRTHHPSPSPRLAALRVDRLFSGTISNVLRAVVRGLAINRIDLAGCVQDAGNSSSPCLVACARHGPERCVQDHPSWLIACQSSPQQHGAAAQYAPYPRRLLIHLPHLPRTEANAGGGI